MSVYLPEKLVQSSRSWLLGTNYCSKCILSLLCVLFPYLLHLGT